MTTEATMSANPTLDLAALSRIEELLARDDRFDLRATRELLALLEEIVRASRVRRIGGSREELAPVTVYQELLIHLLTLEVERPEHDPETLRLAGVRDRLYLSRERLIALARLPAHRREAAARSWGMSRLNRLDKDWWVRGAGRMAPTDSPEAARHTGLSQAAEGLAEPASHAALDAERLTRRVCAVALLHNTPKLLPSPLPPHELARRRWRQAVKADPAGAMAAVEKELPDLPALVAESRALADAVWRAHYQAGRGGASWPTLLSELGSGGAARATPRVACWIVYGALVAENTRDAAARTRSLLTDWGYRKISANSASPNYNTIKKDIERLLGRERCT